MFHPKVMQRYIKIINMENKNNFYQNDILLLKNYIFAMFLYACSDFNISL